MAYDAFRRRVLMFGGGYGSSVAFGDTWEWDGVDWIQHSVSPSPSARWGHALAFDDRRGRVVLFGGFHAGELYADVWEWDGAAWEQILPD